MKKNTNRSKQVLFVLIPEYADWEVSLLAPGLRRGFGIWENPYEVSIVAPALKPIRSIGGFNITPDYDFNSAPDNFAALILVGGTNWMSEEALGVLPLIHKALENHAVLGGICDGSKFLALQGFLNHADHTSNGLNDLIESNGRHGGLYCGESRYRNEPSILDGRLVTANGAGFIEFTCNVLRALEVAPEASIRTLFEVCKCGSFIA